MVEDVPSDVLAQPRSEAWLAPEQKKVMAFMSNITRLFGLELRSRTARPRSASRGSRSWVPSGCTKRPSRVGILDSPAENLRSARNIESSVGRWSERGGGQRRRRSDRG